MRDKKLDRQATKDEEAQRQLVRDYIIKKDITTTHFAKETGFGYHTINRWLRRETKIVNYNWLILKAYMKLNK